MKRILVTGSEGYIGSILMPRLHAQGFEAVGLDVGYYADGDLGGQAPRGHSVLLKDVRRVDVEDLLGFDAIIHLAALSNDPLGKLNPELTLEINHRASIRLAELARQAGVRRFFFASSCSLYGKGGGDRLTEESEQNPQTAYARSKVLAEQDLSKLADDGFSPVYFRNGTAFGYSPRMRFDLVVNSLSGFAHTTGEITILGDGKPWRPLVHVRDICDAMIAALRADRSVIHDQAFNVGDTNENYQIKSIAEHVKEFYPDCNIKIMQEDAKDSRDYNVAFDKLNQQLGFKASWSLDRGIEDLKQRYDDSALSSAQFEGREFSRLKQLTHLLEEKKIDGDLCFMPLDPGTRTAIEGVRITPLRRIPYERGTIYHMLRSSDPHFTQFGEIYFSKIHRGAIKGWHIHRRLNLAYCVVDGMVKLVLHDSRPGSPTHGAVMEIFMGDDNYVLVQIPIGVANGHAALTETALLASCPDISHDRIGPDEMIRIDPHQNHIPYDWAREDH